MKKALIFVLAISSVLLLAGCSSAGKSETSSESKSAESSQVSESAAADAAAATDSAWWREYTDAVGKKDTDLNFMGLGLNVPLSWTDLIPYIDEMDIKGRDVDETMGTALSPEEMLETDKVLAGTLFTVTINGSELDFSLGIPSEEQQSTPIGECVKSGKFILNTRDVDIRPFLGLSDSAAPADANKQQEYWMLEDILEMYGQPDLVGEWNAGMTAFYWERDGYYFGVEAQTLPEADYMVMSYATYIPESAWDFYSNKYLTYILGWPPLVPYEEAGK